MENRVADKPFRAGSKKEQTRKWWLIVDLSSPKEGSINGGINTELSSLSYASVDHLAALIVTAGRSSSMVKADIQEAYRMVPVHPEDQHLLGVHWEGFLYTDKVLPFGLHQQWLMPSSGYFTTRGFT